MLSNEKKSVLRWSLWAALLACGAGAARAAEGCPKRPGQPLRHIEVFDGPSEEMASLVPDRGEARSGHWTLGYVYDAGRFVTLRCKYLDGQASEVRLSQKVQRCDYRIDARQVLSIRCK